MEPLPVYAREELPTSGHSSIFLAGPTPRSPSVPSWRPEALRILRELGYGGHVFIPEPRDGEWHRHYDEQVTWEEAALHRADVILFWVPRDMSSMPALTTNDEWGYWKDSGKVVLGAPLEAPAVRYQRHYATQYSAPQAATLEVTVRAALDHLKKMGAPAPRTGGELEVPAHVWTSRSFQNWYRSLRENGNRLDSARVEWTFWVGPSRSFLFFWVLKVKVWLEEEGRHKDNEVVLSRPDVSTVVLHGPVNPAKLGDTEVVLVREYRSPVNNLCGYVYEPPGGSSKTSQNPRTVAADEVHEETGFNLDPERVRAGEARQLLATLSAHRSNLFTAELTTEEVAWFRAQAGVVHGVAEDTERTYVEVYRLSQLTEDAGVDWSALGTILTAVARAGGHL